jgi:predicted kinase
MNWLVVLIGSVGSGKTSLAMEIKQRIPCVVVANDHVRQELFPQPDYSQ